MAVCLFFALLLPGRLSSSVTNERPIIGILATPLLDGGECITLTGSEAARRAGGGSCFHSLYVKWIEAVGGRVVPIPCDASRDELDTLFAAVNGILLTGGETDVKELDSTYMRAAGHLLNLTIAANQAGEHVPLWGTCMGIQTMSILVSQDPAVLTSNAFDSESLSLPLKPSCRRSARR